MGSEWRPVQRSGTATPTPDSGNQGASGTSRSEASSSRPSIASPRWYEPKPEARRIKVYLGAQDVRRLIASAIGNRLGDDFRLFLGDNIYYLPPLADAQEVITQSGLSRAAYLPETFDCDDFAMVLKAHFCEAAYKNYQRRAPHCFGLIWGELPHVHAVNWMINDDYRLRLIEPQTGQISELRSEHRNITFMMA